jgi:phosphoribosylglycinamide formyltransferase-1
VNEHFDEGEHIAQFSCEVNADDTIDSLAARIQELEHKHFAKVVEKLLT